jgi:uncharacterized membrane protein
MKVFLIWGASIVGFFVLLGLAFSSWGSHWISVVIFLAISSVVAVSMFKQAKKDKKAKKLGEKSANEQKLREKHANEQQAIKEAQLRNQQLMQTCPAMVQKLQSTGFSSLNQAEKSYLFKLSDQMGRNLENLHENEVKVLEAAFSNQGVYNMLQMRSSQLQPNNQAALNQLKGIKYASMISGVNAAREMGESFSE